MDIITYLESRGLEYKTAGKNIGKGWVGMDCPFCDDQRNHFGINKKTGKYSCWHCAEHGRIIKFIMVTESCNVKKAITIAKTIDLEEYYDEESSFIPYEGEIIPKECAKEFPNIHLNYLKGRNFNPTSLIKKYKLRACHNSGKYRFRIIAPVFFNRQIVSFIAGDVTGKAEEKYLFPPNDKTVLPVHDCLYNIDNAEDRIILVEGITDVWRIGGGAVGLLGKQMSKIQMQTLIDKEITRVVVIPDSDAIDSGEMICEQLSGVIDEVMMIYLDEGDPADMNPNDLKDLKETLL